MSISGFSGLKALHDSLGLVISVRFFRNNTVWGWVGGEMDVGLLFKAWSKARVMGKV